MADFTEKVARVTDQKLTQALSAIRTAHNVRDAERQLVVISETLEAAAKLGAMQYATMGALDGNPEESQFARLHAHFHAMFVLGLFSEAGDALASRLERLCGVELNEPRYLDPPQGF
ncbi:MAG: hypothetical protein IT405_00730 [Candidatus Yanofskybacteria bacterium]|nr:hypothetical protein [Candidatus Yanofskybacteria bacterium]